jgi:hypothetical protein
LFTLLREVAWCTQDAEHFSAIADQLTRLRRTVAGQDFDHRELEVLTGLGDAVEEALRGDWSHGS